MEKSGYRAIHKTVIARKIEEKKRRESNLIIPDTALTYKRYKETPRAIIISISPESEFYNDLKPGDIIIYTRNEGRKLDKRADIGKIEEDVIVLKDRWILARIEEDE